MASTRLAAVLSAARGVSCRGRSRTAAAVPPTPVDAIGRDRARPAIPAGATIETQVDVAHAGAGARSGRRTAARRGPRCRPPAADWRPWARPGAPRSGVDPAPQCPPAGRSAAPGRPLSLERRSGGVSRGRRRLHRPVKGAIDAPNSAHVAVISASMCRCRRVSTGPAARRAAHQPARGAAQGPPAIPPAPPLSSRPPARAGGPIGTRARAFWEFHRKGKRGTMGKGLRGKAKSENGRSADPPQRRNG